MAKPVVTTSDRLVKSARIQLNDKVFIEAETQHEGALTETSIKITIHHTSTQRETCELSLGVEELSSLIEALRHVQISGGVHPGHRGPAFGQKDD